MININKTFSINGKGPFTYTITSTNPNVSFKPNKGTTDKVLNFVASIDDSIYGIESIPITINVKTTEGCKDVSTFTLYNPCLSYSVDSPLLITSPNIISFPPNSLDIVKYEWSVGPNLEIETGQNTASISVKEKINSPSGNHSVSCTVYSAQGCRTTLGGYYTTCRAVLNPFNVIPQCGDIDNTLNGIAFTAYNYKIAVIIFKGFIHNSACPGCAWDYSTVTINIGNTSAYLSDSGGGILLFDKNISSSSTYTYSISDTCGKLYTGKFNVGVAVCGQLVGCHTLPTMQDVHINCSDISSTATNAALPCGATPTMPYYTFTSTPIVGTLNPLDFNWNTFYFIPPTNNGTILPGYIVNNNCMQTPYGRVTLGNNHELIYVVTNQPDPNIAIAESFEYRVTGNDNCVSTIGSKLFVHTCVSKPVATDFTECIRCADVNVITLSSHITLNGLTLTNIELDLTGVPNTLAITSSPTTGKINVNAQYLTGIVTFKYRIEGTRQSSAATTKLSDWQTITLDIKCAGASQSIVVC